jgi:hypothetical protein
MVCGLWFGVCGLWFVVCSLWFVVCGLWFVVWGLGFGGLDFEEMNVGGAAKSVRLEMGLEVGTLTVFIYCRVCKLRQCILADDEVMPMWGPPPRPCL